MAGESLTCREPTIAVNNAEGCILFQLLFQVYAGSGALDAYFARILDLVRQRMTQKPHPRLLQRHLLTVFLAAFAYNAGEALRYMEACGMTVEYFAALTEERMQASFVNQYERKTLVIGLSQVLVTPTPSMEPHMLAIVQVAIQTLNKLTEQEAKALKKAGKKEIALSSKKEQESDEDDEGDDEFEDDDDDEDYEEDMEHEGAATNLTEDKKGAADEEDMGSAGSGGEDEQEEQDGGPDDNHNIEEAKGNGGGLGFVYDDEDSDGDGDEDDSDNENMFDLNVTMDLLNAPFKKADEFVIFNTQLRQLFARDATYTNNLVAQLKEHEKKFLSQLMETKRVEIEHKGVKTEVARRIIHVKRRGGGAQ
jgi:hypothetical protein